MYNPPQIWVLRQLSQVQGQERKVMFQCLRKVKLILVLIIVNIEIRRDVESEMIIIIVFMVTVILSSDRIVLVTDLEIMLAKIDIFRTTLITIIKMHILMLIIQTLFVHIITIQIVLIVIY